jgi:TRAP-type C4-dicarboxylate transport system permease small subunit
MQLLKRINNALSRLLLVISGLLLTAMMLLACSNMVLRAFGHPVQGTYELMGFFGAVTIAFGLASTQKQKGHIALTVLAGVFPKRIERAIDMLSSLATCAFFGLIAWRTAKYALNLAAMGEYSETLRVPYYPFPMAVAAGCALLALTLFIDFLEVLAPEETA